MSVHASLNWKRICAVVAVLLTAIGCLVAPRPGGAATSPGQDQFYRYTGRTSLAHITPGTVLKTRTLPYHLAGLTLPLTVTQLLYRSTGQRGQPTVSVTSVVRSPGRFDPSRAVSYQSFYDSLNPADQPSSAIAGGRSFGGIIADVEVTIFGAFLAQGYSVIVPDTEGQNADFSVGPEYGMNTLDSIRAASSSPTTGLNRHTRIGLIGYSGGAIATNWAAELAPAYAPDVNRQLIGAAEGGVLADPAHNLHYISGSAVWAGVMVMAVIGIARAFDIDLTPYLNSYGLSLYRKLKYASISTVLGAYPGLTWARIAKPAYPRPEGIPVVVRTLNLLNMSTGGTPTVPMFIGQGAGGILEGTRGTVPGIGAGDGVMVAGDVRSLARGYCAAGTRVEYHQYDLSHVTTVAPWLPAAIRWLDQRFAGVSAPANCASIAPGNPLTPLPIP